MVKITNVQFKWLLEEWYRTSSTIWNKSTADAIRYTKTTGVLIGWSDHLEKWQIILNTLASRTNGLYENLSIDERKIADAIFDDTYNALNGR